MVQDAVDTRTRLLDAAEELIAAGGIAGTSVRAITQAAGANLAAVNYHFGSRQELIAAVFARRIEPLNRERLRGLEEAAECAGAAGPSVEDVLDAFVVPALRLRDASPEGPSLVRLMGRVFAEPSDDMHALIISQFAPVFRAFHAALVRLLPDASPEEVAARFRYVIGALVFTMMDPDLSEIPSVSGHDERTRLVNFLAAGLRSPSVGGAR